jgi:hypothetical protein
MSRYRRLLRLLRCYHHETDASRRVRLAVLILQLSE